MRMFACIGALVLSAVMAVPAAKAEGVILNSNVKFGSQAVKINSARVVKDKASKVNVLAVPTAKFNSFFAVPSNAAILQRGFVDAKNINLKARAVFNPFALKANAVVIPQSTIFGARQNAVFFTPNHANILGLGGLGINTFGHRCNSGVNSFGAGGFGY